MVSANALLSFLPLPAWGAILLFLAGIVVPLAAFGRGRDSEPFDAGSLLAREIFPKGRMIFWTGLFFCALFLRFFQLTNLSGWPNSDEAWHNFFAVNLMKHWQWNLLYGVTHMPPGYFWLSAFSFKLVGVSLAALWFLPALLSLLAWLGFTIAARTVFSNSTALVFSGLIGLTYWPLFQGRMSHPGILVSVWEALCCVLLAFLLAARRDAWRRALYFLLGLAVGAGFYTFTSWWSAALVFSAAALVAAFHPAGHEKKVPGLAAFLLFLAGLSLASAAFLAAVMQGGYGSYFSTMFLFRDRSSFDYGWRISLSYLTLLFWGKDMDGHSCPPWLVFLNPLWATVFFTGVLVILRSRNFRFGWFLLASIPLFLAPGLLSISVEPYRINPVMPSLFGVAAIGSLWLLNPLPVFKGRFLFACAVLLGFAWDAFFLIGVYHQRCGRPLASIQELKSVERWRAFPILQAQAQREGPGVILTDFVVKPFDQSLNVPSYPFDWLRNPGLDRRKPSWLAVMFNPHFLPMLEKSFSPVLRNWLSQDLGATDGGLFLAVIPTGHFSPAQWERWLKANQAFRAMTLNMLYQVDKRGGDEILGELEAAYPLVKGDRFLECCYWQRAAFDHVLVGNIDAALEALQSGLKCAGPNAFFLDQMGLIYWKKGDRKRAGECFQKARDCPMNLTCARQNLDALEKGASFSGP